MDTPFIIPLGVFAMVVIIVAITQLVKIREIEMQVHQKLYQEELEHRRKMQELVRELEHVKESGK